MWDCKTGKEFDFPVQQPLGFMFSRSGDTLLVADRHQETYRHLRRCHRENKTLHPCRLHKLRQTLPWAGLAVCPVAGRKDVGACRQGGSSPALLGRHGQGIAVARGCDAMSRRRSPIHPTAKSFWPPAQARVLLHEVDGSKPPLPLLVNPLENAKVRDFHHTPRVEVGSRYCPNANCVAMASNGQRAAAGWTNGLVTVWDTASGKLLWQARVIDLPIHCVTFAADDQTVISSGLNGQVVWWDAATGRVRRKLERVPGKEFNDHESLPFRLGPPAAKLRSA